jgi:hypothetical protein
MKCDSHASFLADTFASPYLGHKLKARVATKGTKGAKVKVFFQGLHMTHVIFVLVYNLNFFISDNPFNIIF